jgi:hypothetical protein
MGYLCASSLRVCSCGGILGDSDAPSVSPERERQRAPAAARNFGPRAIDQSYPPSPRVARLRLHTPAAESVHGHHEGYSSMRDHAAVLDGTCGDGHCGKDCLCSARVLPRRQRRVHRRRRHADRALRTASGACRRRGLQGYPTGTKGYSGYYQLVRKTNPSSSRAGSGRRHASAVRCGVRSARRVRGVLAHDCEHRRHLHAARHAARRTHPTIQHARRVHPRLAPSRHRAGETLTVAVSTSSTPSPSHSPDSPVPPLVCVAGDRGALPAGHRRERQHHLHAQARAQTRARCHSRGDGSCEP